MLAKKKKIRNYLILMDGSSIPQGSVKHYRSLEILKDNYSPIYLSALQHPHRWTASATTSIAQFFKKYATKSTTPMQGE